MRMPSADRLVAAFRDLDRKQALQIRRIGRAVDSWETLAKELARVPGCESDARNLSAHTIHCWRVTYALRAMDRILGTHGIEAFGNRQPRAPYAPAFEYLNAGDTYATTLIYTRDTDTIRIGSWGGIAEKLPRKDLSERY